MNARKSGSTISLIPLSVGLGAGAMYLFDPNSGPRRRALVKDKLVHESKVIERLLDGAVRDVRYRGRGLWARLLATFSNEQADDGVLVARVRTEIGRKVSHPHALEVDAYLGVVTLRGQILQAEIGPVLDAVQRVRGVESVVNQLEVHESPARIPALQGQPRPRSGDRAETWPPIARVAGSIFGASLVVRGARRGGLVGTALAGAGALLALRGVTNTPARRLIGVGNARRGIELQKTITVNAPVDEVYSFWAELSNFPRFMQHVREIRVKDDGSSHWKVIGPLGTSVEWDAVVTRREPNETLAWRTTAGASVEHSGMVRFTETESGKTKIDIHLAYKPPAGALGHAVASLFRADPKHAMDEDLVRMKSLLEHGKATAHGKRARIEELH